jgi:phosphatidylethanolamine/phosphatidyl-N-methylethanolamine N-methyltransferase
MEMPSKRSFLKQFWKEKKMVGSMTPSSRFLAAKMLENVDFANSRVIVELGPGTGVFTEKIIEKLHPEARLLVFELNDLFFDALSKKINDPRVLLIHDSAERISEHLAINGLHSADAVISSLPLANFPDELKDHILKDAFNCLENEGKFIQFQYSLLSKKNLENIFGKVTIAFTPFNFPPAFVYTCQRKAS